MRLRNLLLLVVPLAGCAVSAATSDTSSQDVHAGASDAAPASSDGGGDAGLALSCTPGASPSFTKDVLPVFQQNCGAAEFCHGMTWSHVDFAKHFLFQKTDCPDHRPVVAPSEPGHSYLIDKLTNTNLCSGKPMPKPFGGAWEPIDTSDLQTIYDWICTGAVIDGADASNE